MVSRGLVERASQLAAILDALDDAGPGSGALDDAQLVAALGAAGELRRLVDAAGVRLAAEADARSAAGDESSLARRLGERSGAALVAAETGIDIAEASTWCAVGGATRARATLQGEPLPPARPELAAALQSGVIGVDAAAHAVAALDEVARHLDSAAVEELERTLVAVVPGLGRREVRRLCRGVVDRVDPDGAAPREEELRARSGIRITQDGDGLTRWIVTMHPEAAGMLAAALDARTAPRRVPRFGEGGAGLGEEHSEENDEEVAQDRRTLAQRRLDALVELARDSLAHDDGRLAGSPVTMIVTVPLEVLRSGLGSARISGIEEPVSAATARRLAADAELIPAVLGTRGEILDQGRAARLATPGQRRALELRDGGCLWPRCTAPPRWCEVAHVVPWFAGGTTDLANLVLLCPFHHRRFDADGWTLERRDGVPWLIPPAHVDAARRPRRAGPRECAA